MECDVKPFSKPWKLVERDEAPLKRKGYFERRPHLGIVARCKAGAFPSSGFLLRGLQVRVLLESPTISMRCAFCFHHFRVSPRTRKNPLISVFPCLSLLVRETRMIHGASLFVLVHSHARSIAWAKGWLPHPPPVKRRPRGMLAADTARTNPWHSSRFPRPRDPSCQMTCGPYWPQRNCVRAASSITNR